MSAAARPPRGRYAPSPTGAIHVGNARSALAAWLAVRRRDGAFVWREEDLDPPRVVPGMAAAQRADLAWLGLDWDEGPDVGGPHAPYRQSQRGPLYEAALAELARAGRLFPCRRSRRDLTAIATAPHGGAGGDGGDGLNGAAPAAPYPAAWRPRDLAPDGTSRFAPRRMAMPSIPPPPPRCVSRSPTRRWSSPTGCRANAASASTGRWATSCSSGATACTPTSWRWWWTTCAWASTR